MNDEDQILRILRTPKSNDYPQKVTRTESARISEQTSGKGLKIAAWILLGCGLIIAAAFYIDFLQSAKKAAQAESNARIEQLRQQQLRNEAQQQQDLIKAEQQQKINMEKKQRQQQALIEKMNQADQESKRKQAKWELYYQKSPLCIAPSDWKQKVQCANERLKAEERFEALYSAGKL